MDLDNSLPSDLQWEDICAHFRVAISTIKAGQGDKDAVLQAIKEMLILSSIDAGLEYPLQLCNVIDDALSVERPQGVIMNETKDPTRRMIEEIKSRANACRRIENELDAMQMRATTDYERSQINHLRMQMQSQRGELVHLLMVVTGEA